MAAAIWRAPGAEGRQGPAVNGHLAPALHARSGTAATDGRGGSQVARRGFGQGAGARRQLPNRFVPHVKVRAMSVQRTPMTRPGFERLRDELDRLKRIERPAVIK